MLSLQKTERNIEPEEDEPVYGATVARGENQLMAVKLRSTQKKH